MPASLLLTALLLLLRLFFFLRQQEAQAARAQTDGYKLDKNHTFKVSMFDDFDRYAKVPDTYAAPEVKEYSPTVSSL
jgi:hypothetical protein